MSDHATERLYQLLPAIYRRHDFEHGEALRALLGIVEGELRALAADVGGLYANAFIETCDEWVVPYIGDLLGVRGLDDAKSLVVSQRARVANTLAYRRRKGTLAALERLIRDVSGWGARAVELYDRLSMTQHLEHVRPGKGTLFDLRSARGPEPLGGPFETFAYTAADLRSVTGGEGRCNLGNLALFLWRLGSYGVAGSPAAKISAGCYAFHPLGYDGPLFTQPRPETDMTRAAEPDLPGPIRPSAFERDLEAYRERYAATPAELRPLKTDYYGPGRSLAIRRDGTPVPPFDVVARDLGDWTRPAAGAAVDVRRGRLAFAAGEEPAQAVAVDYHYGFSAEAGGGPYDRHDTLTDPSSLTWHATVAKGTGTPSVQQALDAWVDAGRPHGLVSIADSGVYGGALRIELPENGRLAIEAADGTRPALRLVGDLTVAGPADGAATLVLNGLLVEGGIRLQGGVDLTVAHCTLLPGRMAEHDGARTFPARPAVAAEAGAGSQAVNVSRSIVGAFRLPAAGIELVASDSVVGLPTAEGTAYAAIAGPEGSDGPATTLERVTVFGAVSVRELTLASEVVFTAPVTAERCETGGVRFCYLPAGSRTPPRFRCQPELALARAPAGERAVVLARLEPRFTSVSYGDPAFAQLAAVCATEIRTGAEDDSEMGAFRHLQQTQRETNLRGVLDDCVPAGLAVGLFYLT